MDVAALVQRYRRRETVIGVVGLGYVGLPLSCAAASAGFQVVGFDIDPKKAEVINQGLSYLETVPDRTVAKLREAKRFTATTDFTQLQATDAVIICVPTPLTAHREPDLRFVESTARVIASNLRPGHLVVLESTTWPGTTAEVLEPILETSGLRSGHDFFVAFSPEREDPGNPIFSTSQIPKVVGANDPLSRRMATEMYSAFVAQVVPVSSASVAEAVKLTENIFRSVNIALVNELKVIFEAMNIDVWEVIEAAKTKPFGFMPFYPGPGLGGHCIPIDPFYLTWKAREYGLSTRFIELSGEINRAMPDYVVERFARALDARTGRGLNGSRILIIGVAYKKNINDSRESPGLSVIETLEKRGATADFFDPHVLEIPSTREHPTLTGRRSISWNDDALKTYDGAIIITDHDAVDYASLVASMKLVLDSRNVCERMGLESPSIVKA